MKLVYFGHHKCASQYINGIFQAIGHLLGLPTYLLGISHTLPLGYHTRPEVAVSIQQRRDAVLQAQHGVFCFGNADEEMRTRFAQQGEYRGFHVIRDPRDLLVSAYFSHLYSHPEFPVVGPWYGEQRRRLQQTAGIEAGLLCELEFCATYFDHLAQWNYHDPCVYETRYETLTTRPLTTFRQIFNFLGIPTPLIGIQEMSIYLASWSVRRAGVQQQAYHYQRLPVALLWLVLYRRQFIKLAQGRVRGEENQQHHYRKGVIGDWRTYFTPRLVDLFKARYGTLLIQLGYERNEEWTSGAEK